MSSNNLILASSSPRRLELLKRIGIIPNEILSPDIDETPKKDETPKELAQRLAIEKVESVNNSGSFVLAGDTVVACGRRVLDKPSNEAAARKCLSLLSGRRHHVYGGIALVCPDGRLIKRTVDTIVKFKCLSHKEIDEYINSKEWQGKAGGYAIQGYGGAFVSFVRGSPTNVVGLCIHDTLKMLTGVGFKK